MVYPITTPCAHNFCKACLEGAFAGQSFTRQRGQGRRTLRVQKNVMKCPSCIIDIADFLQNPQVTHASITCILTLDSIPVPKLWDPLFCIICQNCFLIVLAGDTKFPFENFVNFLGR
jgi:hypothetical protein